MTRPGTPQRGCGHVTTCAIVAGIWLAIGAGCGGAAKDASPSAASPSNAGAAQKSEMAPSGYAPPPPTAPPATSPPGVPTSPGAQRRLEANADFDRAERELSASSSDCASACRALASLERATVRLCDLAEQPDDVQRCDDAKKKLRTARDRVRSTCSACPGGPSVDRDAPIPSR